MKDRFRLMGNFLVTDDVPETLFGFKIVADEKDYTEEDRAFFKEHPEAGGYYDLGEDGADEPDEAEGTQGAVDGGNVAVGTWNGYTWTPPKTKTYKVKGDTQGSFDDVQVDPSTGLVVSFGAQPPKPVGPWTTRKDKTGQEENEWFKKAFTFSLGGLYATEDGHLALRQDPNWGRGPRPSMPKEIQDFYRDPVTGKTNIPGHVQKSWDRYVDEHPDDAGKGKFMWHSTEGFTAAKNIDPGMKRIVVHDSDGNLHELDSRVHDMLGNDPDLKAQYFKDHPGQEGGGVPTPSETRQETGVPPQQADDKQKGARK